MALLITGLPGAGKTTVAGSRHAPWVYRLFADETPRLGEWLDSGHLTPEQTAAAILRA